MHGWKIWRKKAPMVPESDSASRKTKVKTKGGKKWEEERKSEREKKKGEKGTTRKKMCKYYRNYSFHIKDLIQWFLTIFALFQLFWYAHKYIFRNFLRSQKVNIFSPYEMLDSFFLKKVCIEEAEDCCSRFGED